MENPEEILQCLEEFSKIKPKDIPRELEEYLCFVAKTGNPVYQWPLIKSLFRQKLVNVITEFYESCPTVEIPPCLNVDLFNYNTMKTFILEKLDTFVAAPFTVQRVCELLTTPRKQYNRIDKYMRALEKNILVVSTTEPVYRSAENGDAIVNGLESDHLSSSEDTPTTNDINIEEMDDSNSTPPHPPPQQQQQQHTTTASTLASAAAAAARLSPAPLTSSSAASIDGADDNSHTTQDHAGVTVAGDGVTVTGRGGAFAGISGAGRESLVVVGGGGGGGENGGSGSGGSNDESVSSEDEDEDVVAGVEEEVFDEGCSRDEPTTTTTTAATTDITISTATLSPIPTTTVTPTTPSPPPPPITTTTTTTKLPYVYVSIEPIDAQTLDTSIRASSPPTMDNAPAAQQATLSTAATEAEEEGLAAASDVTTATLPDSAVVERQEKQPECPTEEGEVGDNDGGGVATVEKVAEKGAMGEGVKEVQAEEVQGEDAAAEPVQAVCDDGSGAGDMAIEDSDNTSDKISDEIDNLAELPEETPSSTKETAEITESVVASPKMTEEISTSATEIITDSTKEECPVDIPLEAVIVTEMTDDINTNMSTCDTPLDTDDNLEAANENFEVNDVKIDADAEKPDIADSATIAEEAEKLETEVTEVVDLPPEVEVAKAEDDDVKLEEPMAEEVAIEPAVQDERMEVDDDTLPDLLETTSASL